MDEVQPGRATVYLETTVVSYLASRPSRDLRVRGHQVATHRWWEEERGRYNVLVSSRVIEEARRGDPQAAAERLDVLLGLEVLADRPEVEALAALLRDRIPIPERYSFDAFHMAFAIAYELDYLLTWNCSHLANAECSRRLADLSREHGFWLPIICTPDTLIERKVE